MPEQPATIRKKVPPYFRCEWDIADASALQAMARGEADADQQKRALDWIIKSASMAYDLPFYPGEPDAQNFAVGRQFVGKEIVTLLTISTRDLLLKEQRKQGK